MLGLLLISLLIFALKPEKTVKPKKNKVVLIVIDGAMYQDSYDISYPILKKLSGRWYPKFYNNGCTFTISSYFSILTGKYRRVANDGSETLSVPNLFDKISRKYKVGLLTTKRKLNVLYSGPEKYCGFENDKETFDKSLDFIQERKPDFLVVGFREPDGFGHMGDRLKYIQGLMDSTEYAKKIIDFCESLKEYKDRTTYIVTNDHGRHTYDFKGHGHFREPNCEGCKRIMLFVKSPEDKKESAGLTGLSELTDLYNFIFNDFY